MQQPFMFAVLLVKYADSSSEPVSLARAQELFTKVGRGKNYIVDWFDDNTHGNVDIGESQVFGWFDLPETTAEFSTKGPRTRILSLARQAAQSAGVDLTPFQNIIVVSNLETDSLWGSAAGVSCTAATAGKQVWEVQTAPSVLCQEMIHGLGIPDHSRMVGSDVDYRDQYDVMSLFDAVYSGVHPTDADLPIGPGLNAAFMARCGWLDESRVTTEAGVHSLRPLHRRDLPGFLCAKVGGLYVEYRPKSGWDTGYPNSVVLLHRLEMNTSYLVQALTEGEEWGQAPDPLNPFTYYFVVRVDSIDDESLSATVNIQSGGRDIPVAGPAVSLGGLDAGGGGLIILGGRIIRIPPRSPELRILEGLVTLQSFNVRGVPAGVATQARVASLETMLAEASAELAHLTESKAPQPRAR